MRKIMPQNTTLLFAALWLAMSITCSSARMLAQDAEPSRTPDPEVVKLKAEKEKAELREALAQDNGATYTSSVIGSNANSGFPNIIALHGEAKENLPGVYHIT